MSEDPATDDPKRKSPARQAHEILQRVKKGEDFATLAALYSDDPKSAGDGGAITLHGAARFGDGFVAQLSRLSEKRSRDVIRSPNGWHVVELVGRIESEFAELRDEITRQLEEAPPTAAERRDFVSRLRTQAKIEKLPLELPDR